MSGSAIPRLGALLAVGIASTGVYVVNAVAKPAPPYVLTPKSSSGFADLSRTVSASLGTLAPVKNVSCVGVSPGSHDGHRGFHRVVCTATFTVGGNAKDVFWVGADKKLHYTLTLTLSG